MIWKTTNALGQEVTWYSEDEIEEYRQSLADIRKRLYKVIDEPITHHLIKTTIRGLIDYINEVLNVNS